VTFTGRVGPEAIARYLSAAVIGVCPDPLNPLNDVSTMNKVMEYMSFAVPVVSFDLRETRVSAADTGVYVDPGAGVDGLAGAIADLLDDEPRRIKLSLAARERAVQHLDWRAQAVRYVEAWSRLVGPLPAAPVTGPAGAGPATEYDLDALVRERVGREELYLR
jgi:glycosyltransferase involved in cell wall biosynthesis